MRSGFALCGAAMRVRWTKGAPTPAKASREPGLLVWGMAMAMYELFSAIEKHTTAWAHRGSQNR